MKNFLKITSIFILSIFVLCYAAFLIVPYFINLDGYKSDIQKLVKENTKLNLEYSKIKLYSTPMLSFGAIIENIEIKLDDNSTVFTTPKIKAGLALPSLLTLTLKTSKCYVESPHINLEIVDNKQYKVVQLVEDIINENNKKPASEPVELPISQEIIDKIRIKVPSIKISNYNLEVQDLKTKHNLNLKGNELELGYYSKYNAVKLKTDAQLLSDNNDNINAFLRLLVAFPKFEVKPKEQADPDEIVKIPFINIIDIYQKYDLKMDVESKLMIKPGKKGGIVAKGYLDVDNLNLKLSNLRLPNSYFHSKFHGKKIEFDSNIYANNDEKLALDGFVKYGKHPKVVAHVLSEKISFSNLFDLTVALLDSLNINHGLASVHSSGCLSADATIDTNFKTLKSNGFIKIDKGYFINPKSNIGLSDINANFNFDNNELNIENTYAKINNSKISLNGNISKKAAVSVADIVFNIDKLSLAELYSSFAPYELKKLYNLNSAILSVNGNIKGELNKINASVNTSLSNLNISDSKKTIFIKNKNTNIAIANNVELKDKKYIRKTKGKIENSDFNFSMPQLKTTVLANNIKVDIDNNSIVINPFDTIYNGNSKINLKGEITNYIKNPKIDIFINGGILTSSINQTLGKEIAYYIPSKGTIPFKISIVGDKKKQDILAQVFANSDNYISPISLKQLVNGPSIFQTDLKLQGNKIKIKDSGLYKVSSNNFSNDLKSNMHNSLQLADLNAVIDNNHINLFRFTIPKELSGFVSIFKNSSFSTIGKITLHGNIDNIYYDGDLKINNLSIPEILFKLDELNLNLASQKLALNAKKLNLNGSKMDASLSTDLKPSKVIKVSNILVSSELINVDNAMEVLNKLNNYMPPASSTANANVSSSSNSSSSSNIPLLADGKYNIKKLTTGEIVINNIKGNLAIKNNELLLDKLSCKAFEGDVKGSIAVNLISQLLKIKLNGKNLDSNELMTKGAGLKDTLSGTMDFSTDISLKGTTYEQQVKSLKGKVFFDMENGQYGPFSKLENFFLAENIRENSLFKNTIGIILTPIATIDSSHFENLQGNLIFNNGIVTLDSITSRGNILCILIKGEMDLLKNELDAKVRVRLASTVSDMLGPLSVLNPINLIKNTPGLNIATAKLFSVFTQVVGENEYKEIPDFSKKHSDNNATKFQIVLSGDVNKPLKLVKSFKWLALQDDMNKAEEFSKEYIKNEELKARELLFQELQKEYEQNNKLKVTTKKILKIDTTAPEIKEALVDEIIQNKKESIEASKQIQQESQKQQANELQVENVVKNDETSNNEQTLEDIEQ